MEDDDIMTYNNYSPEAFLPEIQTTQQAMIQATIDGNEYKAKALKAQMDSAKAARANAMKIAQLQASTSRYGIDAQSATAMRALKENARQFDAEHGLEIARAYVAYSATPDLMWSRNDFVSAMGRVGQSGGMPGPIATSASQPQAKTWQDFSAIAQYNGSQVPGGSGGGGQPQAQSASSGGGGGGSTTDPRVSAANAVMKAIPPSQTPGNDGQDWAALESIRNLYSAAQPGSLERLGAERRKIAQSGMARLGYDPKLVEEDYRRSLPGQSSPLLA